ncbi:MAG: hypothetical protein WBL23_11950 [Salinisphaera sp.]|uniref:hypothetical protein n=1 Tax=Salinisphaera sp. TaxID=1914330 RepID=UPI003C7E4B7E
MGRRLGLCWLGLTLIGAGGPAFATSDSTPRLVVIDQDGSGPGGSNMRSMLALIQAPGVKVLGISMVTGNALDEDRDAAHAAPA